LRGHKSNRDAIGTAVTVEAGTLHQTKYLQAGSGFLSQHTKELFFGLGRYQGAIRATVRWPSGLTQTFNGLPVNRRIEIEEGSPDFMTKLFAVSTPAWAQPGDHPAADLAGAGGEILPSSVGTWLIEPVSAPDFSLPDLAGNLRDLRSFRGKYLMLIFCAAGSPACRDLLQRLRKSQSAFDSRGLLIVAIHVDDSAGEDSSDSRAMRAFAAKEDLTFPILLASQDVAGIYNIVYRYLFDRHRDLSLPTSFLIDEAGNIVKLYQGTFSPEQLIQDLSSVPKTPADRIRKALPFPGTLHQGTFQRNAFTYGVAFFQHGFLDQATQSFQQVIATRPDDADAYYNLGTLYLRRDALQEARQYLEQTVKLRPNYPEAWNNLGMIAAQRGNTEDAIRNFQQSLQLRPSYATALLNLGNIYRRQGNLDEAETLLKRAFDSEPRNPEVNYGLGMLYARRDQTDHAAEYLESAITLRPGYADALNNLGVVFAQQQRYPEAEEKFNACIQAAPDFDQGYLNLARLYLVLKDKEKARAVLQALLQKQPQHKLAQQMMQLLY
jgi:Flp pilus assembly protein TadD/peroxiredoxin